MISTCKCCSAFVSRGWAGRGEPRCRTESLIVTGSAFPSFEFRWALLYRPHVQPSVIHGGGLRPSLGEHELAPSPAWSWSWRCLRGPGCAGNEPPCDSYEVCSHLVLERPQSIFFIVTLCVNVGTLLTIKYLNSI